MKFHVQVVMIPGQYLLCNFNVISRLDAVSAVVVFQVNLIVSTAVLIVAEQVLVSHGFTYNCIIDCIHILHKSL